jgi:hypothetical protein
MNLFDYLDKKETHSFLNIKVIPNSAKTEIV